MVQLKSKKDYVCEIIAEFCSLVIMFCLLANYCVACYYMFFTLFGIILTISLALIAYQIWYINELISRYRMALPDIM